MLSDQYILFKDNATEIDVSKAVNNFRSGTQTFAIVATEDAIFIGSRLPFNHRHFEVETANDSASEVSVYLWDGNNWKGVNRVIDYTSVGGITLAQSGIIEWIPDKDESWAWEEESEDITDITANIYYQYWAKLVFSVDLNASTAISYVGHLFSTDEILFDYYPDLDNSALMSAFEAGKTDWKDQHFAAAEAIVRDLKSASIVKSANQILRFQTFELASVYKTAEIIYQGLGNSYRDDRDDARKLYKEALKLNYFDVDINANAELEEKEMNNSMRFLTR